MSLHIFGIRHHGPGSARSLRRALEALAPDCLLVEGPPEAAKVLPLLMHEAMQPPVALLLYVADKPELAVYYPFAVFSPEWQALHYALQQNVPARFMDLPQTHRLAEWSARQAEAEAAKQQEPTNAPTNLPEENGEAEATVETAEGEPMNAEPTVNECLPFRVDPIGALAQAAGYSDSERWWEHLVEHRRDSQDLFAAILEAMTALRNDLPSVDEKSELQREAFMRQTIRAAEGEGYQRIAVVCGAWHAPALVETSSAKTDAALLKGLPKIKVEATWVPWTYGRLTYASGYGAGIPSPGWYDHLWHSPDRVAIRWLANVARLLREEDLDASPAAIIEAARLAETLAALRQHPLPGLAELNEATQTVFCFGDDAPMRLIGRKLIVSERLGKVPDDTPMVPLAKDLLREQKRLRLMPEATEKTLAFDLRKPTDLERSHLLHRLNLLSLGWGKTERVYGRKGTFNETWRLQWQPEFSIKLIEAGIYGNTIEAAATARVKEQVNGQVDLPQLTAMLDATLLADLPEAVKALMTRLQNEAALTGDVAHLMGALPPLANVLRYGNVRQTDTAAVAQVVEGMVTRICISLPLACASLADEAAEAMFKLLMETNSAIQLLDNEAQLAEWRKVLARMAEQENLHGLLAGRCCRVLLDGGVLLSEEAARRMGLALSLANEPAKAAAWVEGFLKGSGLLLLHDDKLWQTLDAWVTQLHSDAFAELLPLLRRTFATFAKAERRQMGERVKRGADEKTPVFIGSNEFDSERADSILPLVAQLLGLKVE
ncbi:MAG: hypothetical protein HY231_05750 [Acidobacteria bacterium]|nr:hypothetical protein [Acidobacteriota bacterium]